jgi:hypothetical protein
MGFGTFTAKINEAEIAAVARVSERNIAPQPASDQGSNPGADD